MHRDVTSRQRISLARDNDHALMRLDIDVRGVPLLLPPPFPLSLSLPLLLPFPKRSSSPLIRLGVAWLLCLPLALK